MARINVEDDFWTHPRYRYLVRLVGDEDKATGMCIRAWRIAQKFWAKRQTIPLEVWDLENLEPMVTAGLAIRREDGVYCRGSKTHFDWYVTSIETGRRGGQKSAQVRAEKYGTPLPKNATNAPPPKKFAPPSDEPKGNRRPPSDLAEGPFGKLEGSAEPSSSSSSSSSKKSKPSDADMRTAEAWAEHARSVVQSIKINGSAWVKAIRDLRVLDGLTELEIAATLDWIKRDDFWRQNAVSPVGLRKPSRNGLRKIDNIRLAMAKGGARPATSSAKVLTAEDLNDL